MTKYEFKNLNEGDMVRIISNGQNRGKMGIVRELHRDWLDGGRVSLEPVNCEFGFSKSVKRRTNKDGLYGWNHENIGYPITDSKKEFYVAVMYGEKGVSWQATNFNTKELVVIERFLEELNEHVSSMTIDAIVIMDAD